MRQSIIEKLFNSESLTNDEINFVIKNTQPDDILPPYNHDSEDIYQACGITKEKLQNFASSLNAEINKYSINENDGVRKTIR